jgi:glycosyltransferase involved in cell wall biosynthesis
MSFISILIPTKDYTKGLVRLLENLPKNKSYVKIIISDDSVSGEIESYVKKLKFNNLIYIKNTKTLGAPDNWNRLLEQCNSKYFMFMHHDDYISDTSFFYKLFKFIKKNKKTDIISVDVKVILSDKNKWHIHYLLRYLLSIISKKYILKRNYLGSVSSLIIKNNNIPYFDTKLQWLLDIDFYYRIMLKKKTIFTNQLNINSEANHKYSITYSIRNEVKKINYIEFKYLQKKYNLSLLNKFLFFLEPLFWFIIRLSNLILKK